MKKSYLLIPLLCLIQLFYLHGAVCAQANDVEAIKKILTRQQADWNKGDINSFMKGYWKSDSLLFIGKSISNGYHKTLENYKKGYPDTSAMGQLNFDFVEFRQLSKEYYFVIGKWHLKRMVGDLGGSFTLLFKKINGNWNIVVDHSS